MQVTEADYSAVDISDAAIVYNNSNNSVMTIHP